MLLLAVVAQAAAVFAPPAAPLRVVTERAQDVAGTPWRFRVERTVRFARDGAGWRAEVRIVSATSEVPMANAAAMFEAGYAGLIGRALAFRMDAAGKVIEVEGLDAAWEAFCAGVVAAASGRAGYDGKARAANAEAMAAPLRALPAERKRAMLASLVAPLVAEEAGEAVGSFRPVRVPGGSPIGGSAMLEGMRSIAAQGTLIRSTTRAEGGNADGRVTLTLSRDIDPRTGLLTGSTEIVRTRSGGRDSERITTIQVTAES
jgi:hypothetical protein